MTTPPDTHPSTRHHEAADTVAATAQAGPAGDDHDADDSATRDTATSDTVGTDPRTRGHAAAPVRGEVVGSWSSPKMGSAPKAPVGAPRRPAGLKAAGRALWDDVLRWYDLLPHEHGLLAGACRQQDVAAEARRIISAEGLVVDSGRAGLKAHPAVGIERNALAATVALLKSIGVTPSASDVRDGSERFTNLRAV